MAANGQPAFAVYELSASDKRWNAHSIHVLTRENETISRMTLFLELGLFHDFGLPKYQPHEAGTGLAHDS
jgi:hypothetical protein